MSAGIYELLLLFAGFVAGGLWVNYRDSLRCKHQWGKWSDPLTQDTRNSFSSASKAYQVRICASCNESQSRTISEVVAS